MSLSDKLSFITVSLKSYCLLDRRYFGGNFFSQIPLMMLSRVNHKFLDRGNHHEFLSLVKELARPGDITQNTSFDFEFNQVEKPYECYTGANVKLR